MPLEDVVGETLMSVACQNVNFTFANVSINGNGYSAIAIGILTNRVHIVVNPNLPPSEAATYNAHSNTMTFQSSSYGTGANANFEKQTIVHEATHAIIDAQYAGAKITQLTTEVAAYIAGSYYNIYAAVGIKDAYGKSVKVPPYIPPAKAKIYFASQVAVAQMINRVSKHHYTGAVAFNEFSAASIIKAIKEDPLYTTKGRNPSDQTLTDGI